ncbi:MAG: D-alanyl-D-alanine carboxypeptidase family protein [Pseudomonadota bacterium]
MAIRNHPGISLSVLAILAVLLTPAGVHAQALFETKAKQAFLVDAASGSILFQKQAESPMPPASLAKLMTMEVVFNALKIGQLTLDDEFNISENAWRKGGSSSGGSTMFAKLNSNVRLEDLIRGVIVQSANDACIAIAEGMAGSEGAFAGLMNERAKKIGLKNSNFTNSTGLPDELQTVTSKDLAFLARHIIQTYPEYYAIYAEPEFTWNKIRQRNRNPLLGAIDGADGMKTGFTEASGYGIVGSALRNDQRLIMVLNGMSSKKERREESRKMMNWAFRAFRLIDLFDDGEIIGEARLFGGAKSGVALKARGPLRIYVPIGNKDRLKARVVYQGPIVAPVEEGAQIAILRVEVGGELSQETPLYAAESVGTGSISQRAMDGLQELLLGWL